MLIALFWTARSSIINSFYCECSCFAAENYGFGFYLRCRRVLVAAGLYPTAIPLFQGELDYLYCHTNSGHIYLSFVQSFCQTEGTFHYKSGAVLNSLCSISLEDWRVQPPYP